ncbi:MAG: Na+/H+ antiporter subunit E [Candidatus Omnitrophota bacterium]
MKGKVALFFVAFALWCLLSWVPDIQHIVVGLFVSLLVAFLVGDLFVEKTAILKHPHRYFYFLFHYIPVFLWECIKANVDVAYRIIHPALPIKPGIVRVKTKLRSDTGLTFLANSITLTPGTMTVDIDRDKGILYIHWINVDANDIEEAESIVRRFEKILEKIFE